MIIHDRDRYVFVAVPKTATTTIHNYLRQSIMVNDHDEWLQKKYHYPLSSILKENKHASNFLSLGFHETLGIEWFPHGLTFQPL